MVRGTSSWGVWPEAVGGAREPPPPHTQWVARLIVPTDPRDR